MRRVLVPCGRLATVVWDGPSNDPFFTIAAKAIGSVLPAPGGGRTYNKPQDDGFMYRQGFRTSTAMSGKFSSWTPATSSRVESRPVRLRTE